MTTNLYTPNLGLPLLAPDQAQKHVTHNEAILNIDGLLHINILDRDLSAPPLTPNEGDVYLIASGASGLWSGKVGKLALFQDSIWQFFTPKAGWIARIQDENEVAIYDGTTWNSISQNIKNLQNINLFGVGTTADNTNPFSMKINAGLISAKFVSETGTGDLRLTYNKENTAKVLSHIFQSNWTAKTEMGLVGDDDFVIRNSTNGTTFTENIRITNATARLGIGVNNPTEKIDVNGNIRLRGAGASTEGSCIYLYYVSASNHAKIYAASSGAISYALGTSTVSDRVVITPSGNMGIGVASPSTTLHVEGPVRVKSYTVSTAPSASATGAGSQIYISDEAGGAVIAFSDGTNWRRVTDRAIIS